MNTIKGRFPLLYVEVGNWDDGGKGIPTPYWFLNMAGNKKIKLIFIY